MLGVIMGAVTMKMINNTNITSMKGTMLISEMVRRPRPREEVEGMLVGPDQWPDAEPLPMATLAPKLRCKILENSSMKVSNLMAMRSTSCEKRL